MSTLSLELHTEPAALLAAIEVLKESAEVFPGIGDVLRDLLFEGGDSLAPSLIELRSLPADGAGRLTVALDLSERFREIVAAARAGEIDRLRSYCVVQVHGGSHAK
ncbi:MAG: hypothetical protein V4669_13890 [Pseudomonadota bacterium]